MTIIQLTTHFAHIMKIGHIALWTGRLEELKDFYTKYFGGRAGNKYVNPTKGFESYFIHFDGGTALEIMSRKDISEHVGMERLGYCHIAFDVKNREEVLAMTERFRNNGYIIAGEPRTTGDGMFESVVLDPEGNRIEICSE